QTALQPGEMPRRIGEPAAEHRPHLIDPVGELIAAIFYVHRRIAMADKPSVHISHPPHQSAVSSIIRDPPNPSDFSLRCRAERSMPMKAAVREMLPPKRMIWASRYSRSKSSRASRSGKAIIRSAPRPPLDGAELASAGNISAVIGWLGSPAARMSIRSTTFLSCRTVPG